MHVFKYTSSFYERLYRIQGHGTLDPIPAPGGIKVEYTLYKLAGHYRVMYKYAR